MQTSRIQISHAQANAGCAKWDLGVRLTPACTRKNIILCLPWKLSTEMKQIACNIFLLSTMSANKIRQVLRTE